MDGAATEKARVPAFVFTRGRGLLLVKRSCLEYHVGMFSLETDVKL